MARKKNDGATKQTGDQQADGTPDAPETPAVGGMEDEQSGAETTPSTTPETTAVQVAEPAANESAPAPLDPEESRKAQLRAELQTQLDKAQADVRKAEAEFAEVRRELDERCEARDAQVNAIDRAIGDVRGKVEKLNQQLHQVLRPAVDKINRKLDKLK